MAYLNTGSAFNIPTDVYSRSGLPKQYQESILSALVPNMISSAKQLSDMGNPNASFVGRTMRSGKDAVTGGMTGVLNKLVNRGMMNSQTASDALTQLGMGLNQQIYGNLADMQTKIPGLLGNLVGLGQSTENPFQPYQSILSLIQSMM